MLVKNTTIQNKSKQKRLISERVIPAQNVKTTEVISFLRSLLNYKQPKEVILYSIGVNLLKSKENPAVEKFLNEYSYDLIPVPDIPNNEFDLLGSAYQFLNTKIENLEKGCFYTGSDIAKDFVEDLKFDSNQTIFDPACGSGAFLLNSNAPAEQVVGVDFDPVAIMIAKFNYFIKFPSAPYPKLFCEDFFDWYSKNKNIEFDYIIGNPPYGATLNLSKIPSKHISSGESFSYFIEFSFELLTKDGLLRFLLPEAILNVKRHTDIRKFILSKSNLRRIKRYSKKFSGVMSDVYMLELAREGSHEVVFIDKVRTLIPRDIYQGFKNHVLAHLNERDISIIEKVNTLKAYDLSTSTFGLGIVTGDNKTKIFKEKIYNSEHIYTGKEVGRYNLLPPQNYLIFDRNNLQQVAPDEIYRSPEKLVYKTINKHLRVALDTTKSLTSNSANIIIPKISDLGIYTIMGFLNSDLYSYLHLKLFGGVNKIAKENLMALPLPGISKQQNKIINELTNNAVLSGNDFDLQNYINFEIFNLTNEEVAYIKDFVPRKTRLNQLL